MTAILLGSRTGELFVYDAHKKAISQQFSLPSIHTISNIRCWYGQVYASAGSELFHAPANRLQFQKTNIDFQADVDVLDFLMYGDPSQLLIASQHSLVWQTIDGRSPPKRINVPDQAHKLLWTRCGPLFASISGNLYKLAEDLTLQPISLALPERVGITDCTNLKSSTILYSNAGHLCFLDHACNCSYVKTITNVGISAVKAYTDHLVVLTAHDLFFLSNDKLSQQGSYSFPSHYLFLDMYVHDGEIIIIDIHGNILQCSMDTLMRAAMEEEEVKQENIQLTKLPDNMRIFSSCQLHH